MKSFFLLFHLLLLARAGYGQPRVWLIGTAHEATKYVTADSVLLALHRLQPDVILLELEAQYFTQEFRFDTAKYPLKEYLVTNENRASYRYPSAGPF
jgi:pheromone shutdown protein TraB